MAHKGKHTASGRANKARNGITKTEPEQSAAQKALGNRKMLSSGGMQEAERARRAIDEERIERKLRGRGRR